MYRHPYVDCTLSITLHHHDLMTHYSVYIIKKLHYFFVNLCTIVMHQYSSDKLTYSIICIVLLRDQTFLDSSHILLYFFASLLPLLNVIIIVQDAEFEHIEIIVFVNKPVILTSMHKLLAKAIQSCCR